MMKYFKYLNIILILLAVTGCDNTTDVEIQVPYVSYYLIDGHLTNNVDFDGLTIKSTLPIDQPYSDSLAEYNDAIVYLTVNGIRIIPLSNVGNGKYAARYPFKPSAGETYELHGSIGDKTFYCKTVIPEIPSVNNVVYDYQSRYYMIADVIPNDNEVYGAAWIVGDSLKQSSDFYSITSILTGDVVKVRTEIVPTNLRTTSLFFKTWIQVYSFDPAFLDYYSTKDRSKPIDNLTLQGGTVKWNVTGDHIFGLFIGMAKTNLIAPKF